MHGEKNEHHSQYSILYKSIECGSTIKQFQSEVHKTRFKHEVLFGGYFGGIYMRNRKY